MDGKAGESIQGVKREVYQKTSVSSTRFRQKIGIEVNAFDYATGDVLFIEYENGRWRLVTYLSKSLNEIEKNYEIHNKEMLAVIRGLEN